LIELNTQFLTLVKDLPILWKQNHEQPIESILLKSVPVDNKTNSKMNTKTPFYLLAENKNFKSSKPFQARSHDSDSEDPLTFSNLSQFRSKKNSLPWSSPSLRSSPTDQLIAAILDGDVQGVRAVIRSKGDDLKSEFWSDLAKSVLPLHRAVSGLHFHGSEKLLVATIEALSTLGADVNLCDHAGKQYFKL
jgi:hypothetical protein